MVRQAIALLTRRERSDDAEIIFGVVLVVALCAIALSSVNVPAIRPINYFYNMWPYLTALMFMGGIRVFYLLWKDRPERPFLYFHNALSEGRRRLTSGLLVVLAAVVFMPSFGAMKSAIPLFNGFGWDGTFIAWDRALHGGDVWKLLHPVIGYPIVTYILSAAYMFWFSLIYMGTVYFALLESDRELRRRYLASFFGIWSVIGILMAVCLASVGPCFAKPILGIDTFNEQMAYLQSVHKDYPLAVIKVQYFLLDGYQKGAFGFARGITAMPSMHVALAFLFFLAMRKISPLLGWLFGAYFVVILVGSVHLGYHYAVDGYVSIIVTALIWKAAGVWARGHG